MHFHVRKHVEFLVRGGIGCEDGSHGVQTVMTRTGARMLLRKVNRSLH